VNPWIAHVKAVQAAHGVSYKDAMSLARATYVPVARATSSSPKRARLVGGGIFASARALNNSPEWHSAMDSAKAASKAAAAAWEAGKTAGKAAAAVADSVRKSAATMQMM
jgi:hypothetical protein